MAFLSLVKMKSGNLHPAENTLSSINKSRFKLPRPNITKTHSVFKSEGLKIAYTHCALVFPKVFLNHRT